MVKSLIRQTAKELAGSFFENMDVFGDGRVERTMIFREECTDAQAFTNKYWPDFVVVAKKVLGAMLTDPSVTQIQKDAIYDALLESRGAPTDEHLAAPSILRLN